jgi:hypothetical protein
VGPGGLLLLCATPTTCGAPCFVLCALQRPRPPGPCSGAPQFASCLPVDGFSTPLATWWLAYGRGPPAQVSAGAARAWASHCTVVLQSCPPLEPPFAVVCYPLRCRCCARAGAAATDRGYRNSNIYLATRTWGHRSSSTRRPRVTALPPGKWQVCVATTPETIRGLWCLPCACVSGCGQPPPLSGSQESTGPHLFAESVAAVAAVGGTPQARGGGRARVHQASASGGPLQHCFPCGPVNTSV